MMRSLVCACGWKSKGAKDAYISGVNFFVETVRGEAEDDEGVEEYYCEAVPGVPHGTQCNTWPKHMYMI